MDYTNAVERETGIRIDDIPDEVEGYITRVVAETMFSPQAIEFDDEYQVYRRVERPEIPSPLPTITPEVDIFTGADRQGQLLDNAIQSRVLDATNTVIRFPTAFTKDKQIRIIAEQLAEAGLIDRDEVTSLTVFTNLLNNLPLITQQLDEVSTENEKNFRNIADKLVNRASSMPTTESQIRANAPFQYLRNINNPNMPTPIELRDDVLNQLGDEQYIETQSKDFKTRIENLYPIFENDPYASQKKKLRSDLIAATQQQIQQIIDQPVSNSEKAILIKEIVQGVEFGTPATINETGVTEAGTPSFQNRLDQLGIELQEQESLEHNFYTRNRTRR